MVKRELCPKHVALMAKGHTLFLRKFILLRAGKTRILMKEFK